MNLLKMAGAAAALVFAGSVTALAATPSLLDFTDDDVALSGTVNGVDYELVGTPNNLVRSNSILSTASDLTGIDPALALDFDGVGINLDTEISAPTGEFVTLNFTDGGVAANVRLVSAFFLDLYVSRPSDDAVVPVGQTKEKAVITVGTTPGAEDASLLADVVFSNVKAGYGALTGLDLVGSSFTFFIPDGFNDKIGVGDFALAAVQVAAVPVPAGLLLMGTALGGFGIARRRKQRKAT